MTVVVVQFPSHWPNCGQSFRINIRWLILFQYFFSRMCYVVTWEIIYLYPSCVIIYLSLVSTKIVTKVFFYFFKWISWCFRYGSLSFRSQKESHRHFSLLHAIIVWFVSTQESNAWCALWNTTEKSSPTIESPCGG